MTEFKQETICFKTPSYTDHTTQCSDLLEPHLRSDAADITNQPYLQPALQLTQQHELTNHLQNDITAEFAPIIKQSPVA